MAQDGLSGHHTQHGCGVYCFDAFWLARTHRSEVGVCRILGGAWRSFVRGVAHAWSGWVGQGVLEVGLWIGLGIWVSWETLTLLRSLLFAAFVASGFVPMIHACVLDGSEALDLFPLAHVIGMEMCYLAGVVFYVTRFPERCYPQTFDIWVSIAWLYLPMQFVNGCRARVIKYFTSWLWRVKWYT
jgi:predicted membrane channel-forming protein YqfA (hemolysin III family)